MIVRGTMLLAISAILGFAALGCNASRPTPAIEESYPVRSDWLLVGQVPGDPSRGMEPGYPPSIRLDAIKSQKTEPTDGDDLLLFRSTFFNARKVEDEVRDELGKVLTKWFGTPTKPVVWPVDDELKAAVEMLEKLPKMRDGLTSKKAELAEIHTKAKSPEEMQAVNAAKQEIEALTAEIRTKEVNVARKIEDLQTAKQELHLDDATLAKGGVIYRNYCQQCHGLTGDGNGPGARYLIPMPRDYRQGLFKYISTHPKLESKRKPLRGDLHRTITKGLDGSPMPQFGALRTDEIEAVVSYVIHLSIRGEAEYETMKVALDEKGDGLSRNEIGPKVIKDALDTTLLWLASNRTPIATDAEPNPYVSSEDKQEAAARGYRLFQSAEIGCSKCHTNFGRAAPFKYDAWGTIIKPRNLTIATLRGGREPEAIYARIFGGIPGTGMPAHAQLRPTDAEKADGKDKIWDLVHFVMYASESEKRQLLKEKFQIEMDD